MALSITEAGLGSDPNLQGYWKFESNWDDSGPNSLTLTASDSPTNDTAGKFGNGGDFEDGSSQYVYRAADSAVDITGSQSWSCWIKIEAISNQQHTMGFATSGLENFKGFYMGGVNDGMHFALTGLTGTSNLQSSVKPLSTGEWYHQCGVYDSVAEKIRIYTNGVKTEGDASGSAWDSDTIFCIGRWGVRLSEYFDGMIDDVAIFDRALTDAEVANLYSGTVATAGFMTTNTNYW